MANWLGANPLARKLIEREINLNLKSKLINEKLKGVDNWLEKVEKRLLKILQRGEVTNDDKKFFKRIKRKYPEPFNKLERKFNELLRHIYLSGSHTRTRIFSIKSKRKTKFRLA